VSDFVDLAISKIPSSFGKLTLLASLRDASTGRYTDPLVALIYGNHLHAVLEHRHQDIFFAWLGLGLATQSIQVAQHLADYGPDQNALIERWIQERLYDELIPANAGAVERQLFVSDLMTILLLLQSKMNPGGESHR
jgi:hypothetical protein